MFRSFRENVVSLNQRWQGRHQAGAVRSDGPPPPSRDLIDFLRAIAVLLSSSGDSTTKATEELRSIARAYGASEVDVFVLPTGAFVRIQDPDGTTSTDFAAASSTPLRLDQISELYHLMREAYETRLDPKEGLRRIKQIELSNRRFSTPVAVLGVVLLSVGLGLTRTPPSIVVFTYAFLGLIVGLLWLVAERLRILSLALPVVAGTLVTVLAFSLPASLTGGDPVRLLIPPLIIFLPGAALTIGTIELATGSIVAGSARMMYAFNMLFLLAFGIFIGYQLMRTGTGVPSNDALGGWAAWLGVAITGVGFYLFLSAPRGSLFWVMVVLYGVWMAMFVGQILASPLLGAFCAGLVLPLLSFSIENQENGTPAQVTFFPAFWLIVPGSLGLAGVAEFVSGTGISSGIADIITALLTVMSIALGVLVGSSLTQTRLGVVLSFEHALPSLRWLNGRHSTDEEPASTVSGERRGLRPAVVRLGYEEVPHECGGFVGQDSAVDFGAMVEPLVAR
ncbi:threonine/serine ThrE exporter family protein [Haloglycomyces albus]|uniref:threonine/serine ThrE exporter family protein n=1 Tax=Haloglycomyces albus TaxID=526067 RepID=UPI0012EB3280|nr:threonine/serine exporter family protein [Haloglycomyces albus]